MSQKEVWKDNRTGTAMGIGKNGQHWLSSANTDSEPAREKANQLQQEKVEDEAQ